MREAHFGIDFHLESDAATTALIRDTAVSDWRESVIQGTYLHRLHRIEIR